MDQNERTLPGGTAPLDPDMISPQGAGPDKWALLGDLVAAAPALGLRPATLSVLRALLTFLPVRALPTGAAAVVFPSNRALAGRLEGMPEATLRRHLRRLVEAGLIVRRDSANRKRYARRLQGRVALAFGFDLGPFRAWAERIAGLAAAARAERERCGLLREEIRSLRDLIALAPSSVELEAALLEVRLELKRRPCLERLLALRDRLLALAPVDGPAAAPEDPVAAAPVTAAAGRNDRHQQSTDTDIGRFNVQASRRFAARGLAMMIASSARDVLDSIAPGASRSWPSTVDALAAASTAVGIDAQLRASAERVMGRDGAALTLLGILRRGSAIRSPSGYFRELVAAAGEDRFQPTDLFAPSRDVRGLVSRQFAAPVPAVVS